MPTGVPSSSVAPGAQHTGLAAGQSVTGSWHCQSVKPVPVMQAVVLGWHPEAVALPSGVSQQCWVSGVQYSSGPPSVVALKGQKMVPGPASAFGGWSFDTVPHSPELDEPEVELDEVPPPAPPALPLELELLLVVAEPVLLLLAPVVELDVVVPAPVPPVLLELHAPIDAPITHPNTAPTIRIAFFMVASEFLVAAT